MNKGKKTKEKFGVTTREIKRMGLVIKSHFVSEVCMESIGIYWIPVWHLLENNFRLRLVNAQFFKQLPGRKSDVKDAGGIATVLLKELVRDSFVSDSNIQSFRQCGRHINNINKDLVRCQQRIEQQPSCHGQDCDRLLLKYSQTMECGGLFVKPLYLWWMFYPVFANWFQQRIRFGHKQDTLEFEEGINMF